ncbi:MAG: hypothetical protein AB7D03_09775 [Thiomicrospira sp.]|jgi:hypothetical protein
MALNQRDEALLWIGVELYPGLIQSIEYSPNPHQTHAVVYQRYPRYANIVAQQLEKFLRQPIAVLRYDSFLQQPDVYAAFLVEPELHSKALVEWTRQRQIFTFSPFADAVSAGIDSGFLIKEQVKPQLNVGQLRQKSIEFKPFFFKITEHYD